MNTAVDDLLALVRDPRARLTVGSAAALLYVLFVADGEVGVLTLLAAVALGVAMVLWRSHTAVSLMVAGAAVGLAALTTFVLALLHLVVLRSAVPNIAPYSAVLLPILGGAVSSEARHRIGAVILAVGSAVAGGVWAYGGGYWDRPLLVVTVLVCAAPLLLASVWRIASVRALVRQLAALAEPRLRAATTLTWVAVGGVAALWLLAVVLDASSSGSGILVVDALPGALALLWVRHRPELALALTGLGIVMIGIDTTLTYALPAGDVLMLVVAGFVLFLVSISPERRHRRAALALVAAVALGGAVLAHSLLGIAVDGAFAAVPIALAWGWRWMRTAGHLRLRLTESQRREEVVERDVLLEQERTRVARDVHDVVAHSLAVVIAQADGARYAAAQDPSSVGPALETIAETARTALVEVRGLLHDLRSSDHDAALPNAEDVPALIEGVRDLGIEVQVGTYGVERPLDAPTGLALYRVVQEALTNALRHGAPGERIDVDFDWTDAGVTAVVTNAVAPNVVPGDPGAGHGIAGMRERAVLAGGEVTAGVGSTGLFRLRATLPVELGAPDPPQAAAADTVPDEEASTSILRLLGVPASA